MLPTYKYVVVVVLFRLSVFILQVLRYQLVMVTDSWPRECDGISLRRIWQVEQIRVYVCVYGLFTSYRTLQS